MELHPKYQWVPKSQKYGCWGFIQHWWYGECGDTYIIYVYIFIYIYIIYNYIYIVSIGGELSHKWTSLNHWYKWCWFKIPATLDISQPWYQWTPPKKIRLVILCLGTYRPGGVQLKHLLKIIKTTTWLRSSSPCSAVKKSKMFQAT